MTRRKGGRMTTGGTRGGRGAGTGGRGGARTAVLMAVTALLSTLVGAAPAVPVAPSGPSRASSAPAPSGWHTVWAGSQQRLAQTTLNDQSVRSIARLSQGGNAVRVRVQNEFGTEPLRIGRGTVALSDDGRSAAVRAGTTRPLTFHGRTSVTVPAGGDVWSDPVALTTAPQSDLAVSLHVPGSVRPGEHGAAYRDNYLTEPGSGDHVADTDAAAYTRTVGSTYLVSAVDVRNPRLRGTIVAYGSSVVDGAGSTDCGPGCDGNGNNSRWTDVLARRITAELPAHRQLAVANAGINGTHSAAGCPDAPASVAGLEAGPRLRRDVLALHGVTGVIYFYGTNDLQNKCTSDQIISSYKDVFARLHEAGIEVYVVPSTPRPIYTDRMNRYRWDIGAYVGDQGDCGGECNGVVDFDHAILDPVSPNSINGAYDVGDGIHVNKAGHEAEAKAVPLRMLLSSARR
ncbi:GDSL-type esterase/lipase family protein [Streptomyces sp. NPDC059781]|uniref:GDSL-type esterase/lipase family protein n=1 Tax=Streptomyces sp. NPDC059781 TaxID=3346943 RepID=UPI00364D2140